MSDTEKKQPDETAAIRTLENHAPIMPTLSRPATPDTKSSDTKPSDAKSPDSGTTSALASTPTSAPTSTLAADDEIVTFENHAPAPPALDLDGKQA
ncbi:hypothetical protein SAMN04487983_101063 [Streptomyces sp. yr375]|uniref:hypothetical protein n=1 Tax=Streptomyces sp. yr375 TaxID=1761906 RepID=UPI0008B45550|nr:hypothetical protein [Streptomyces sp. yr375]SEQ99539.1 hypothetical protein SAMN04487983_101063 [Streptomyces sp. yr375]